MMHLVTEEYLFENGKHFLLESYLENWVKHEHKKTEFASKEAVETFMARKTTTRAHIG